MKTSSLIVAIALSCHSSNVVGMVDAGTTGTNKTVAPTPAVALPGTMESLPPATSWPPITPFVAEAGTPPSPTPPAMSMPKLEHFSSGKSGKVSKKGGGGGEFFLSYPSPSLSRPVASTSPRDPEQDMTTMVHSRSSSRGGDQRGTREWRVRRRVVGV